MFRVSQSLVQLATLFIAIVNLFGVQNVLASDGQGGPLAQFIPKLSLCLGLFDLTSRKIEFSFLIEASDGNQFNKIIESFDQAFGKPHDNALARKHGRILGGYKTHGLSIQIGIAPRLQLLERLDRYLIDASVRADQLKLDQSFTIEPLKSLQALIKRNALHTYPDGELFLPVAETSDTWIELVAPEDRTLSYTLKSGQHLQKLLKVMNSSDRSELRVPQVIFGKFEDLCRKILNPEVMRYENYWKFLPFQITSKKTGEIIGVVVLSKEQNSFYKIENMANVYFFLMPELINLQPFKEIERKITELAHEQLSLSHFVTVAPSTSAQARVLFETTGYNRSIPWIRNTTNWISYTKNLDPQK